MLSRNQKEGGSWGLGREKWHPVALQRANAAERFTNSVLQQTLQNSFCLPLRDLWIRIRMVGGSSRLRAGRKLGRAVSKHFK